ncbi:MAG TPA: hypothetical protein VHG92_07260 [Afifellaceae bacterium]|nr:hypothetical protein [Afifellaceae bacterium]
MFHALNPGKEYQGNWHHEAIAHRLMLCSTGANTRQIITMPPRSLKSILASVAYPAFLLGREPTKRVICVSYSNELALKHARASPG